jgi:hypothetical protein
MQLAQRDGRPAFRKRHLHFRDPANAGAIAFKRSGDPMFGGFSDAIVIKAFGEVPERLDEF